MSEELKTCPFCGGMPSKVVYAYEEECNILIDFKVVCWRCNTFKTATINGQTMVTFKACEDAMKMAIERWNERAKNE